MVQRLRMRNLATPSRERLEADRHGKLYDRSVREALENLGGKTDVEPLEALAALRLAAGRVHAAIERWTEGHGLSESRMHFLISLYYAPERRRPLGEVAERLSVVPRTITDIADVLERDGLIRREPDASDRRSIHAVMTSKGTRLVESMRREAVVRQTAVFAGFSKGQMAELRHLCLTLVKQLSDAEGER
jgi:DNA-binding MarR family transcriptional regulator